MPSRESRIVLLLVALAVLGHGARAACAPSGPPGALALTPVASEQALAAQRARSQRVGRPLQEGETIDLNSAPAEEIARLPRVGMSLAKRIVDDRERRGAFQTLADLDRVPGIGPALLRALGDRIRFGAVRPGGTGANPGTGEVYEPDRSRPGSTPVDLNSASEKELQTLPGIGPARARAILAYRREHGGFAGLSELERVPGISRSLARRLAGLVVPP